MTIAQEHNFGSPDSSENLDNFLLEDDLKDSFDDGLDADKPRRAGCRKGPAMAEKRNQHNAIERARRESLNGRFMVSTFLHKHKEVSEKPGPLVDWQRFGRGGVTPEC